MAQKPAKKLGRGIQSLIPGGGLDLGNSENSLFSNQQTLLPIEELVAGEYQPRTCMDDNSLQELSDSIKAQGIIQPIIVRKLADSKYEIIAGERRFRAAKLAQLKEVPVVIKEYSDEEALLVGIIENIQRQDLNPIDEALGFKRLGDEFGLTHEEISNMVGKSRSAISNALRLLNLASEVQQLLIDHKLEMGHARALIALAEGEQVLLANRALENEWSVREVERQVNLLQEKEPTEEQKKSAQKYERNKLLDELEESLTNQYSLEVSMQQKGESKGSVTFKWASKEDFEHLMKMLNVNLDDYR